MELTREQLIESNNTLAVERRELSDKLAFIEGIVNGDSTDTSKVRLIQESYRTWNTPKIAEGYGVAKTGDETPTDGQERTSSL